MSYRWTYADRVLNDPDVNICDICEHEWPMCDGDECPKADTHEEILDARNPRTPQERPVPAKPEAQR